MSQNREQRPDPKSPPPPIPPAELELELAQITMRKELQRKLIHLCSLTIPIIYIWLSRETMLWLLVPFAVLGIVVEILRVRVEAVDRAVLKIFGAMLRPHESRGGRGKISGATWVFVSASLCVLIFPKVAMVNGFAVLIISDAAAALIGRSFGRHRFLTKSVEGTSAFAISAILVTIGVARIFDAPLEYIAVGAVASVIAAIVEVMSHGNTVDDNLTIPLSFGLVLWGGLALLSSNPEIARLLVL